MSKRHPSRRINRRATVHNDVSRGCKLRNRAKDYDEIHDIMEKQEEVLLDNPKSSKCLLCDRVMDSVTLNKHYSSREHKRREKGLKEQLQLEKDRRNGLF
ncbi:bud site selection protein 20 [Nematocida sp. LUAm3]|nr:bud site selection protein 20 [Nematocida sp. LUAm3]KAI5173509.1 bud site selection protein 20 [Nematocida sp. LUAm2]KAI5176730.1 bud site selection protein 20 [Nematocida sp. LUAm1]